MRTYIGFFGGGRVILGGIVPNFNDLSKAGLIVFIRSEEKFHREKKIVRINNKPCYVLLPFSEEYITGEKALERGEVLYCGMDSKLFAQAIKLTRCSISACREGIDTYSSMVEDVITDKDEYHIISFDNDPKFLLNAAENSHYSNIHYASGVVHGVVSELAIGDGIIDIVAGDRAVLTFPPSIDRDLLQLSDNEPRRLWECSKPIINISQNDAEHIFRTEDKLVTVNAQHTFQVMLAVKNGILLGDSILTIQESCFNKYITINEGLETARYMHLLLYANLLILESKMSSVEEIREDLFDYELHLHTLERFIRYVYESGDLIQRGLNIRMKNDVRNKMERHIMRLKKAVQYFSTRDQITEGVNQLMIAGAKVQYADILKAIEIANTVIETAEKYYMCV